MHKQCTNNATTDLLPGCRRGRSFPSRFADPGGRCRLFFPPRTFHAPPQSSVGQTHRCVGVLRILCLVEKIILNFFVWRERVEKQKTSRQKQETSKEHVETLLDVDLRWGVPSPCANTRQQPWFYQILPDLHGRNLGRVPKTR